MQLAGRLLEEGQGRQALALDWYEKNVALRRQLLEDNPQSVLLIQELGVARLFAANLRLATGQAEQAAAEFASAIELLEPLASANPQAALLHVQLGAAQHNLLAIRRKQADRSDDVLKLARQAVATRELAFRLAPTTPATRTGLSETYLLAGALYRETGQLDEAIKLADQRKPLFPDNADQLYNSACEYAACIPLVGQPDNRSDADKALRETLSAKALESLKQAIAAGFKNAAHMQQDPDLAPLRDLPEYQQLLQSLMR